MTRQKQRIFISYKRVDKDRVFAIKDGIEQATGEKCWIDLDGIESNAQFVAKIMRAIDECEIFLFMRSKEHNNITNLETDWTIREVNYALEEQKNIVIVNLDNTPMPKWFKFMFPNKQEIDATSPNKLARLNNDLREWLGISPTNEQDLAKSEQANQNTLPKGEFQVGYLLYKASETGNEVSVTKYVNMDMPEIHIPSQIKYRNYIYDVVSIEDRAFEGCVDLVSVTIPDSVTKIGYGAFYHCESLTSITISNSITRIREDAFLGCESLTSITLPNNIKSIGNRTFFGCKALSSINLPNNITSIGEDAFSGCESLTSITLPNNIKSIGNRTFFGCKALSSINLPNNITSIGEDAFSGCESLTSINLPNSIKSIGDRTFFGCKTLRSIIIPSNLAIIGWGIFRNCYLLESITFSNSITSIAGGAFENCKSLKSITIPNSVTSIEWEAFLGCSSLTTINYNSSIQKWRSIKKGYDWKKNTLIKVIHCIDGDIKIGGLFDFLKEPLQFLKR